MNTLDRIKLICNQRDFTIADLERRADIGNGTIRRWGDTLPAADKLQRVARCLNVSIDYLINGVKIDEVMAFATDINDLNDSDKDFLKTLINTMRKRGRDAQCNNI